MASELKHRHKAGADSDHTEPSNDEKTKNFDSAEDDNGKTKSKQIEKDDADSDSQAARAKKLLEAKKREKGAEQASDEGFNPLIPIVTLLLIGSVIGALVYTQWYQSNGSSHDRFRKMVRSIFRLVCASSPFIFRFYRLIIFPIF